MATTIYRYLIKKDFAEFFSNFSFTSEIVVETMDISYFDSLKLDNEIKANIK